MAFNERLPNSPLMPAGLKEAPETITEKLDRILTLLRAIDDELTRQRHVIDQIKTKVSK